MNKLFYLASLVLFSFCARNPDIPENPLFTNLPAASTGVAFSNMITPEQDFNIFNYRNFYNGGGIALGDINNDGLIDIYFTSNQGTNKLYLNEGDFQFRDVTDQAGVGGNRSWTTGVTMADVNGDGLLDIYVLNSADLKENDRRNELFINKGDLNFSEEAAKYNLDDNAFSVHASFFDYDGDGDLDCYLVNNSFKGTAVNMQQLLSKSREQPDAMGGDKLLRNDNGVFTDVSEEAGVYQGEIGFGLGAIVGDVNGDYRPDIYISNDFWERDYLYINQGDGTFSEELVERTTHISQSSMGSDIGDINNDGLLDIFTTDMLPTDASRIKTMTVFDDYRPEDMRYDGNYHFQYVQNTLQVNNGNGTFSETGFLSGVAATDWSWGALIFDFNNNGWNDIFVSNGIYRDVTDMDFRNFISDRSNIARIVREKGEFNILDFLERLPSEKLKNAGFLNQKDITFSYESDSLGFYEPTFSNGSAYADLDNDGDLDLVVNNINDEAFIYRNNAEKYYKHHYLKVNFEGEGKNTFGIGAHVKIYASGEQQVAYNIASRSFQSSVPAGVHFGLGDKDRIDSLLVVWPDHRREVLRNIDVNQEITLKQKSAGYSEPENMITEASDSVFEDITGLVATGDLKHDENDYNDFDHERLLPHILSTEGPELVKGDVNGDGMVDFLVTGALNDHDKLFIQQSDGRFTTLTSPDLIQENAYESTGAEFIDIDGDGDLDLIIGNGGNQFELASNYYRLRAYENNGEGRFKRAPHFVPDINIDVCCIKADDFNDDGNMDIFIGARSIPKKYGLNPRSYLLENNGNGRWIDATPEELKSAGMITDAVWTDYDSDGDNDLIIVGEWMPVTFYSNNNGKLEFDFSIDNSRGWWSAIKEEDLDKDGDPDFILGNWGLNSRFRASPEKPVTMFVNDFNGDGNSGFVINTYQGGDDKAYPFHTYKDLTSEFPFLKERISNHHEYAGKTYEDIFSSEEREGAERKEVQTLHSSLLINNEGNFELKKLPPEAQISPVHSIVTEDFNNDEHIDLLLLGNRHDLKPEVGRLDGNRGLFLFNDGSLNYQVVPYHKSNTIINGEVRDATSVGVGEEVYFIIARNNQELLIFK